MTGPLDDPHPRGLVRALLAVLVLGLLVAVVPLVLVALTQALPVDLGALSPATWGRADDGRLLLVAILAVAWTAWAVMVLSVGVESLGCGPARSHPDAARARPPAATGRRAGRGDPRGVEPGGGCTGGGGSDDPR